MSNVGNSEVDKMIIHQRKVISLKENLLKLCKEHSLDELTGLPDYLLSDYLINTIYSMQITINGYKEFFLLQEGKK